MKYIFGFLSANLIVLGIDLLTRDNQLCYGFISGGIISGFACLDYIIKK